MKALRRLLILSHRYLGIALSLMAIMWFASGFVMMYAGGMPRLSAEMRFDRMPDLDLTKVRLSPREAMTRLDAAGLAVDLDGGPYGRAHLSTVLGRPAYRIGGETVFADTGELLTPLIIEQSKEVASRFMRVPESQVHHLGTLTGPDQWTIQTRAVPLEKFSVDGPDGTELYVQPQTGEVANLTTRRSRTLAWLGTIPHWLYFTALRANQPLWYRLIVWTSGAICVLAVLGLMLSVTQFRRTRPFRLAAAIPYSGWMRWHYVTGAIFGIFTLTWAFSGLLSMEPFDWTNAQGVEIDRDVFTGGAPDLGRFASLDAGAFERALGGRAIKEIEFTRIQDANYYVVQQAATAESPERSRERLHQPYPIVGRADANRVLVNAETMTVRQDPFTTESLIARLRAALPDVPISESTLLTDYDSYYYSRSRQTPLPVLRVKFADPGQTWVYIDPELSQVLAAIPRLSRVERWLYNGLHSLDFAFWYNKRPLWDIGMLVLLTGGLTTSMLGMVIGIRRLRRGAKKAVRWAVPEPAPTPDPALPRPIHLSHERINRPDGAR